MLIAFLFSCKKEKDPIQQPFHISESEKLIIPAAIDLPANIPHGNSRVATFYAEGIQKYKSQPKAGSSPVTYEWVFVAPQADLYDATNRKVGTHSAGPTWQLLGTTDSIYGQAFSPAKSAPSPDPSGIDWLQLDPEESANRNIFGCILYPTDRNEGRKSAGHITTTAAKQLM